MLPRTVVRITAITVVLATCHPSLAQPVPSRDPSSTHMFPAGGRRGSTVRVRVGSECLPPGARLRLTGVGVEAPQILGDEVSAVYEPSPRRVPTELPITWPREWGSELSIAQNASPGPVFWRLTCSQGGTGARPFVVGELPEHIELESNSRLDRAERVELPVTVNGQVAGERDLDYFVFTAREGDVVVCDVLAARIGSALDPVVEMLDAAGRRVEVEEIRVGGDPVLAHRVRGGGDHVLLVSNLTFHGSPKHVYRIDLSTLPYIHTAFPTGGRVGETRVVELLALSGGREPQVLEERVTFPATVPDDAIFWYRGKDPGRRAFPLAVGSFDEVVEDDDNDSPERAMALSLPVAVSGRFLDVNDLDWFRFEAREGAPYSITCAAHPPGGASMPVVMLVGRNGEVLAGARSVDRADGRCRIEWRAPLDGVVRVQVRDLGRGARGSADLVYRMRVRESAPDFRLRLDRDFAHVVRGGKAEATLTVDRLCGFSGAIELDCGTLPEGVALETTTIPASASSLKVVLATEKTARPTDVLLKVVGRAKIDGGTIERVARAEHRAVDADGTSVGTPTIDDFHLTVRHEPVFRLFCEEAYQYAHRGTVFRYPMQLERVGGYGGDIVLQIGDRQNRDLDGIEMFEVIVPSPASAALMPIHLPETMHINIQSQSQLYVQGFTLFEDEWGRRHSQLVVSEKRCMLRTMPRVVKMVAAVKEIIARPGEIVSCELRLERTSNFTGAMSVELEERGGGGSLVAGSSGLSGFAAGKGRVLVQVRLPSARERAPSRLVFRGTGELADGTPVISRAAVTVVPR